MNNLLDTIADVIGLLLGVLIIFFLLAIIIYISMAIFTPCSKELI